MKLPTPMTEYQFVPEQLSAKIGRSLAIEESTVPNAKRLGYLHVLLLPFTSDKYGHWEEWSTVLPVRSIEIKKATTSKGKADAIDWGLQHDIVTVPIQSLLFNTVVFHASSLVLLHGVQVYIFINRRLESPRKPGDLRWISSLHIPSYDKTGNLHPSDAHNYSTPLIEHITSARVERLARKECTTWRHG